jgi:hypothetical protein
MQERIMPELLPGSGERRPHTAGQALRTKNLAENEISEDEFVDVYDDNDDDDDDDDDD